MAAQHRARKRFGQNFLRDQGIVAQIARAVYPADSDHLVEIGPGKGALTRTLADSRCRLDLIELDRDLIPTLENIARGMDQIRIHNADALRFDYRSLRNGDDKLRIVGNLPYNISTPLIFHLLSYSELIEDMHFMLQLEVVNRLAAAPGNKNWGRLGAMAQYHCRIDSLFQVPPSAFNPAPRVQSAVVRLTPHKDKNKDESQRRRLQKIVQAAFSQRRKTLRNALRDLISVQQLEGLGIAPTARGETLSLQQFLALSELLDDRE